MMNEEKQHNTEDTGHRMIGGGMIGRRISGGIDRISHVITRTFSYHHPQDGVANNVVTPSDPYAGDGKGVMIPPGQSIGEGERVMMPPYQSVDNMEDHMMVPLVRSAGDTGGSPNVSEASFCDTRL